MKTIFDVIKEDTLDYVEDYKKNRLFKKHKRVFEDLVSDMEYYQKELRPEENKLNGHEHFMKKKIEDKVLKAIEDDEELVTVQDKNGFNLGMHAANSGLNRVVMRVLDNDEASTQQEYTCNFNLGMMCAIDEMEDCVLKALDNKEACLQNSYACKNIGIYAIESNLNTACLKVLDNKEATFQRIITQCFAQDVLESGKAELIIKFLDKYYLDIKDYSQLEGTIKLNLPSNSPYRKEILQMVSDIIDGTFKSNKENSDLLDNERTDIEEDNQIETSN